MPVLRTCGIAVAAILVLALSAVGMALSFWVLPLLIVSWLFGFDVPLWMYLALPIIVTVIALLPSRLHPSVFR